MKHKNKIWKPIQHYLEYLAVRIVLMLFSPFSFPTLGRIGSALGSLTFHLFRIRRRVTIENLEHAFPEKSPSEIREIAHRTYQNFGRTFLQFMGMSRIDKAGVRRCIDFGEEGQELLQHVQQEGKGGIIVASHFGNWELLHLGFGAYGFPGRTIVRTQKNKRVDDLINQIRSRTGCTSIPFGSSVRGILKGLKEEAFVGIAGDQSFKRKGSVWVDFFGRPALTAQGAAYFHLKTGAPLIPTFTYHQPNGYLQANFEILEIEELSGRFEEDVLRVTQNITARLEQEIRKHPDHWFWMHQRWKDSPSIPKPDPQASPRKPEITE
jgi:KDO2-lipid IV(A) lauroyltransferase